VDRIPLTPPIILPVSEKIIRPVWSVMIPTYNCSEHLKKTLTGVLAQDPGEQLMQIEVVDDFSTDANVEQIVKDIGKGRVSYYRQPENVGSLRNFETCINRANGHYIHLLHGDDCVKIGFYKKMAELFFQFPEAGAAFCAYDMIREDDTVIGSAKREAAEPCILDNWLYKIAVESRLQYVCMVVKRDVYESVGSFYLVNYGEDWEMWTRIAKSFPTAYTPEILAEYRVHNNSITGKSFLTGANVRDISKIIDKISSHIPIKDQIYLKTKARKYYAYDALNKMYGLWYRTGNRKVVQVQIREIFRLYKDFNLSLKVMKIKIFIHLPHAWVTAVRNMVKSDLFIPPPMRVKNDTHIHIALAFDKNYLTPMYVLLTSIFLNNKCNFTFHVIATGLNKVEVNEITEFVTQNNSVIKFYKVDEIIVSNFVIPGNSYFSASTYYRIFFPVLITEKISKLLYLDTDIVVIGDLSKLYNIPVSFPVAAVTDPKEEERPELGIYEKGKYFNSGVLLINIEEWKKQKISKKAIAFINEFPEKIKWVDQDALNAVLINNWQQLPERYNLTFYGINKHLRKREFKTFLSDKIIIHYTTQNKPWIEHSRNRLRYLYYYYLSKSPHANLITYSKIDFLFWLKRAKLRVKEFLIDYSTIFSPKIKKTE
jgi:lipopolysaccharide biosynthesis glycosyltransferase